MTVTIETTFGSAHLTISPGMEDVYEGLCRFRTDTGENLLEQEEDIRRYVVLICAYPLIEDDQICRILGITPGKARMIGGYLTTIGAMVRVEPD